MERMLGVVGERKLNEERKVTEYLSSLGLITEDLDGKKLLDVGSGSGSFVRFANTHGAQAIALDNGNNLNADSLQHAKEAETPLVIGDAARLPFYDDSFDLVLSHAAIPNIANEAFKSNPPSEKDLSTRQQEEQERRIAALKEMLRVVKPEGEVRCAPIIGDIGGKFTRQAALIQEAIKAIQAFAEVTEEPLNAQNTTFRLILKKVR